MADRFFKKGLEAYKEKCIGGGKLIESAAEITDTPIYAFPPTLADVAGYTMTENQMLFVAAVIAVRARTVDNMPLFGDDKRRQQIVEELSMLDSDLVAKVADEILGAYGDNKEAPSGDTAVEDAAGNSETT